MNLEYIRNNFNKITDNDVNLLRDAAFNGKIMEIERLFKKYELLGTCGSCSYDYKKAHSMLLVYESQGWI